MKNKYITTPIYYPNAKAHIGTAYTTIICDVLARYERLYGNKVVFTTGLDEHGQKVEQAAEKCMKMATYMLENIKGNIVCQKKLL